MAFSALLDDGPEPHLPELDAQNSLSVSPPPGLYWPEPGSTTPDGDTVCIDACLTRSHAMEIDGAVAFRVREGRLEELWLPPATPPTPRAGSSQASTLIITLTGEQIRFRHQEDESDENRSHPVDGASASSTHRRTMSVPVGVRHNHRPQRLCGRYCPERVSQSNISASPPPVAGGNWPEQDAQSTCSASLPPFLGRHVTVAILPGDTRSHATEDDGAVAFRVHEGRVVELCLPPEPPPIPRSRCSQANTGRSRTPPRRDSRPARWPANTFDFVVRGDSRGTRR